MKIKITEAKNLSQKMLHKIGFSDEEASLITENLIEAELVEKQSHGLVRLSSIKRLVENRKIKIGREDISVISETSTTLHIDGKHKPGFYVIYKSLDLAFEKVKKSGIVSVGLKDLAYASGYIGAYARKAIEKDLIFIGFNNSPGGLVPFGARKDLWGTNPITVGIPTNNIPVILDMASSKITWGNLLVAKQEDQKLKKGVAIDKEGRITTNPEKAMEGGLLPIAEHKGSGLAFIVELLAGALTNSRVGYAVPGGWGTFYILLDPSFFRPLDDFKKDVETAINELKNAPKAEGFNEVYFPGEKSHKIRQKNLSKEEIEISENLYNNLKKLLE